MGGNVGKTTLLPLENLTLFYIERKLPLLFREEEVFPLFENGCSKVIGRP